MCETAPQVAAKCSVDKQKFMVNDSLTCLCHQGVMYCAPAEPRCLSVPPEMYLLPASAVNGTAAANATSTGSTTVAAPKAVRSVRQQPSQGVPPFLQWSMDGAERQPNGMPPSLQRRLFRPQQPYDGQLPPQQVQLPPQQVQMRYGPSSVGQSRLLPEACEPRVLRCLGTLKLDCHYCNCNVNGTDCSPYYDCPCYVSKHALHISHSHEYPIPIACFRRMASSRASQTTRSGS